MLIYMLRKTVYKYQILSDICSLCRIQSKHAFLIIPQHLFEEGYLFHLLDQLFVQSRKYHMDVFLIP